METYKKPDASFQLSRPIRLSSVPPAGRPIETEATGQLTLPIPVPNFAVARVSDSGLIELLPVLSPPRPS